MTDYWFEWTYPSLYQLAICGLGIGLFLMTVYRHEMSCNAIYDDLDKEELKSYSFYSDDEDEDENDVSEDTEGEEFIRSRVGLPRKSKNLFTESMLVLPPDVQIHILTFLTPMDVTRLACVSREFRHAMDGKPCQRISSSSSGNDEKYWDGGEFSDMLWLALWKRDYALIMTKYKYGLQALNQSFNMLKAQSSKSSKRRPNLIAPGLLALFEEAGIETDLIPPQEIDAKNIGTSHNRLMKMKEFYFLFQQTWLLYLIAGHANFDSCLIGLHGHLFDMTDFLEDHPGSPETLLMQSGRDATVFFESMGHSSSARTLALSLSRAFVGIVDWGCCRQHVARRRSRSRSQGQEDLMKVDGLGRVEKDSLLMESNQQTIFTCGVSERQPHSTFHRSHLLPHKRSNPKAIRPLTLSSIRRQLIEEEEMAQTKVKERIKNEIKIQKFSHLYL